MNVLINNHPTEVPEGATLAAVITAAGLDAPGTATAVDGKIVTRPMRESFVLRPDAKIIVIKGACGG